MRLIGLDMCASADHRKRVTQGISFEHQREIPLSQRKILNIKKSENIWSTHTPETLRIGIISRYFTLFSCLLFSQFEMVFVIERIASKWSSPLPFHSSSSFHIFHLFLCVDCFFVYARMLA